MERRGRCTVRPCHGHVFYLSSVEKVGIEPWIVPLFLGFLGERENEGTKASAKARAKQMAMERCRKDRQKERVGE